MYASGADEKVIRCFEAPKNFVETLSRISSLDLSKDIESRVGNVFMCYLFKNNFKFDLVEKKPIAVIICVLQFIRSVHLCGRLESIKYFSQTIHIAFLP